MSKRLTVSIWAALIAGLFTAALFLALAQGESSLPLFSSGENVRVSLAAINLISSLVIVLFTSAILYRRYAPITDRVSWFYQLSGRFGASILGAVLTMFISTLVLNLLQRVFPGGELPIFASVVVLTGIGALLGFVTAFVAVKFSSGQLLTLAGVTLLSGLVVAAMLARDRDWWTNSLSFLGWNEGSNLLFDFALILGGLIILAVMGDVIRDLNEIKDGGRITQRNFNIARVLVIAIAVSVILIGLFPTRISTLTFIIHQGSAYVGFGAFFILMGGINRLLPIYPAWFVQLGRVLLGAALVAVLAYAVFHFINFVALEVIAIGLVAPWCFIFAQQTDKAVTRTSTEVVISPEGMRRLRFAAKVGAVAGICALVAAVLTFDQSSAVSIFSDTGISFAAAGLFFSFPIMLISTAVSYRRFVNLPRRIGARLLVAVVMALLVSFLVLMLIRFLNATFTGITISSLGAAVLIGAISFVTTFLIAYNAPYFDGRQELALTGLVFVVGIMLTTTHAADPEWWTHSISFLGHDSGAFLLFAITMTLCGLLLIVIGLDILAALEVWESKQSDAVAAATKLGFLRALLLMLGIFTIGVGIFPTTVTRLTNDLHNISSHGSLVVLLLLMFGLNRLIPSYPKQFIVIGYGLGIAAIVSLASYFAGLYNYVIMEFILLIILGVWLYLFFRYTRILTGHGLEDDQSTPPDPTVVSE